MVLIKDMWVDRVVMKKGGQMSTIVQIVVVDMFCAQTLESFKVIFVLEYYCTLLSFCF